MVATILPSCTSQRSGPIRPAVNTPLPRALSLAIESGENE
ncbi:hypothetical protein VCCP103710_2390, partial [Vibrio cholerae CP1037(10)]